ncbi:zinc-binding alcohol dehydrogenase family protein [Chitinophaga barathri]|uniref:Zinc-binding alcohol dehydrogenase family protein n=1 Tax=Chitinophaga barathri TaxID=1647451 RepID=A0A3N4MHF8_9BACT|nr:zinc-binding alcohol dehydrogenase family protein [Chitinophaga barathri]RPD41187.1 zinc-binding alcohol dehydrogenase family protein [Chitinophaga barathri]
MKALVLQQPGEFTWTEKPHPGQPPEGYALLRIKHVSVCGTDLHAYKGRQPFFTYPRILGHEVAAEVTAIGDNVSNVTPGDLVSVEPYRNPVTDQAVRRGKTNCGSQVTVLGVHEDGAMQEYILYPAANLHVVNGMNPDEVALIEPFAIGCHAVERAEITDDDTVLVIGAGPIGLAVMALARLKGIRIAALDINENRLQYAKKLFPEIETVLLKDTVVDDLRSAFDGELPTVVFDATGNKTSMERTFEFTAAGGTIVFVGLFVGDVVFADPVFHRKEITLKASRSARAVDFRKVIQLFKAGLINTEGYISHRIKFENLATGFTGLYAPEANVIKAIIDF